MNRPLCSVLMPFGTKQDFAGTTIDFDAVYEKLVAPAISDADLEPVRADEGVGGIIQKPMFERLILCHYAVADLTTANANVFYELGIRHAVRPFSTVPIFAEGTRLPLEIAPTQALSYRLTKSGQPTDLANCRTELANRLRAAREPATDSPVFQLVGGLTPAAIDQAKTDVFRKQVEFSAQRKAQLATARKQGLLAVRAVQNDLGNLADVEASVAIDLFLSYRAVSGWSDMIALVDAMPRPLRETIMVQEELGLALSRAGHGDRAGQVLEEVLRRHGPSSQIYQLLGRVYKDGMETAAKSGDLASSALMDKAIHAYRKAFETDWRDAYPGINALMLMEIKQPPDPEREKLKPLVRYAVERRIATAEPGYWDYAALLEVAVLEKDEAGARAALSQALACLRELWEAETTLRNLRLISTSRSRRGEAVPWAREIEKALEQKAG